MFIHTEVDACTLNCRHNVSNFSVVEAKMKRPLVSEGRFFPVYIYGMCKWGTVIMYTDGLIFCYIPECMRHTHMAYV